MRNSLVERPTLADVASFTNASGFPDKKLTNSLPDHPTNVVRSTRGPRLINLTTPAASKKGVGIGSALTPSLPKKESIGCPEAENRRDSSCLSLSIEAPKGKALGAENMRIIDTAQSNV
jgi:hypothetical protein